MTEGWVSSYGDPWKWFMSYSFAAIVLGDWEMDITNLFKILAGSVCFGRLLDQIIAVCYLVFIIFFLRNKECLRKQFTTKGSYKSSFAILLWHFAVFPGSQRDQRGQQQHFQIQFCWIPRENLLDLILATCPEINFGEPKPPKKR